MASPGQGPARPCPGLHVCLWSQIQQIDALRFLGWRPTFLFGPGAWLLDIPSTNILLWKITMLLMGKPTISMAMFNCYVSSPEGISKRFKKCSKGWEKP